MRSLAAISLWLVPAVLMYLAYVLFRRLGTNRRSLERLFTEPADLTERPDGDSAVGGFLRRWLFLAGYRQPAAPAAFVAAMLLAMGLGLAAVFAVRDAGLTNQLFRNIAQPPAGRGRSPCPDCVPGTLDCLSDPGTCAVAGCPAVTSAACGSGRAGLAHLLGIASHAQ